ncbi:C13 family peptidase [bacterium]|nr:C13 family peptidase [bacterium]
MVRLFPFSTVVAAFLAAACAKGPQFPLETIRLVPRYEAFAYRDEAFYPLSEKAHIFLVAGGQDYASFAEEIIRQKRHWMDRGALAEEISCYYAIPSHANFRRDAIQFAALAAELRDCYAASAERIYRHLRLVLAKSPPDLYLYVTGHGSPPVSRKIEDALAQGDGNKAASERSWLTRYPVLDQFILNTDVDPSGEVNYQRERVQVPRFAAAWRPEDMFLTPTRLTETLDMAPKTRKHVVLQGCYTGGFIDPHQGAPHRGLKTARNISVITASHYDRPSFGCSSGIDQTFFGQAYNSVLQKHPSLPQDLDWSKVYEETEAEVGRLEVRLRNERPSKPQYFSNLAF